MPNVVELRNEYGTKDNRAQSTVSMSVFHKAALKTLVTLNELSSNGAKTDMSSALEEMIWNDLKLRIKSVKSNGMLLSMINEMLEKNIKSIIDK